MIIVSGKLYTQPGQRDAFLTRSTEAVRAARQATGCLDFAVSADLIEAERVNIYEAWESRDALLAFRGSGPSDDLGALVAAFDVSEHTVLS